MELTCLQPPTTSSSSLDIVLPTTSSNTHTNTRKRSLEAEEEELQLPEEFQPLTVSTPNVSSYTTPDGSVHYNMKEAFIACGVCVR